MSLRSLCALFVLASLLTSGRAWGQACCAGSGVVTPGRLGMHERALVGSQLKAGALFGSFDNGGHTRAVAAGSSEFDFEESLFGAIRFLKKAQASLLIPLVETSRSTRTLSEFGGGIGDINLGGRYDFTVAGRARQIPGVAGLIGLTLPSGTAPESASKPLATDATGIGAFQMTLGLAIEQTHEHWLFGLSTLVSKRTSRSVQGIRETLGAQLTLSGTAAYVFDSEASLALLASYMLEDSATINGQESPGSARHVALVSFAGMAPLSEHWRVQGSLFANPPISSLGRNQPMTSGLTVSVVRNWM